MGLGRQWKFLLIIVKTFYFWIGYTHYRQISRVKGRMNTEHFFLSCSEILVSQPHTCLAWKHSYCIRQVYERIILYTTHTQYYALKSEYTYRRGKEASVSEAYIPTRTVRWRSSAVFHRSRWTRASFITYINTLFFIIFVKISFDRSIAKRKGHALPRLTRRGF